jgi:hypothetical protein
MATITAAALISIVEPLWNWQHQVLTAALWLIAVGGAVTALRRSQNLVQRLKGSRSSL